MGDLSTFSGWDHIDAEEADSFQSYLDTVTGLESMQALKRRSHRLLSPTPGYDLLDVGCGNGDDVLALAREVGPDGTVFGVDNSTAMVEEARNRASDSDPVSFEVADAERLPFGKDTFDGSRTERVLQHLERPRQAFAELCRVTRPGGRVVVTDPDGGTMVVDTPEDRSNELTARILDPAWSCARNDRLGRQLRRWALDAGLTDLDIDTATIVLTDFETANEVLGLTGRVETMQESDALTEKERTRWLNGLRRADENGVFFSSIVIYTVGGTVPTPSPAER